MTVTSSSLIMTHRYVFEDIQFREFYDTKADPWQQHNLWNSTSADIQGSLHAELVNMFTCTGTRASVSNCHARAASPLLPPAPAPPAPAPPPNPPGPGESCNSLQSGVVLNATDILGHDMVSPCQVVAFPGTYTGSLQCQAMCAATSKCGAWTFHYKSPGWRCCVKNAAEFKCTHKDGMWSGIKQK